MPTRGELTSIVKEALNQGDKLDSLVDWAIRQSVLEIEQAHSFLYMQTTVSKVIGFQADLTALPNPLQFTERIKEIVTAWTEHVDDRRDQKSLYQVDLDDLVELKDYPTGRPEHFAVLDRYTIQTLEADSENDWQGRFYGAYFTDWDGDVDEDDEHFLTTEGEGVLVAKAVERLAPALRERPLLDNYREILARDWPALVQADMALRNSARDEFMIYRPMQED